MGIRFRCPKGHKLHVKAFLAGKRGICPHCGEKFQIPLESDPELVKSSKLASNTAKSNSKAEVTTTKPQISTQVAPQGPAPAGDFVELSEDLGTEQPVADAGSSARPSVNLTDLPTFNDVSDQAAAPAENKPAENQPAENQPAGSQPAGSQPAESEPVEVAPAIRTPTSSTVESPTGGVDPIDEAPHAVWYVRPPSGGQFGPATADVMRSWITEGRVTADSLVWREGWPEWKPAGPLFPRLPEARATPSVSTVPQIVTHGAEGSSAELYRRRKSNKSTLLVVFMLLIACLILFGALVYVVRFMN
jgi:hypothetical protein